MDGIISGEISKKVEKSDTNTDATVDGSNTDNADFLKVDFYNKRDILMGTEYVNISDLER